MQRPEGCPERNRTRDGRADEVLNGGATPDLRLITAARAQSDEPVVGDLARASSRVRVVGLVAAGKSRRAVLCLSRLRSQRRHNALAVRERRGRTTTDEARHGSDANRRREPRQNHGDAPDPVHQHRKHITCGKR